MTSGAIKFVGVVVPIHNERQRLPDAMASLAVATMSTTVPVSLVFVLDACTDDSERIGRGQSDLSPLAAYHWIPTVHRRASSARSSGVEKVVTETGLLGIAPRDVAVLTTDADTTVPKEWISDHVVRLDSGDDAVAGIVDLERSAESDGFYERWRHDYSEHFRRDGSHPHVHCANLAVRLSCLNAAGGFGHHERAEDIDLWRRLEATPNIRLRSDHASLVTTSARSDGRVDGGFATALNVLYRTELNRSTLPRNQRSSSSSHCPSTTAETALYTTG